MSIFPCVYKHGYEITGKQWHRMHWRVFAEASICFMHSGCFVNSRNMLRMFGFQYQLAGGSEGQDGPGIQEKL